MMKMDQMKLVCDVVKAFGKQKKTMKRSTLNVIIASCNAIIAEEERPFVAAVPGMGLVDWLASDDTGLSSKFMAKILCNGPRAEYAHPLDASDFGRCYRFLKAVSLPGVEKSLLKEMSVASVKWAMLVAYWPELEKMYEAKHKNLSAKIDEILKGCEK